MVIREYSKVELVFSSSESEAVKIALVNLRPISDLLYVLPWKRCFQRDSSEALLAL